MDPVEGFLVDIREHPEDDAPRLIFADWLDDHGDPARAEFIRLGVELAQWYMPPARRRWLVERIEEIRKAHEEEWLGPLLGLPSEVSYELGFPCLSFSTQFMSRRSRWLIREGLPRSWCQSIRIVQCGPTEVAAIGRAFDVGRLRSLSVRESRFDAGIVRRLLRSAGVKRLYALELAGDYLGANEFDALADAVMPRLRQLRLSNNGLLGARALQLLGPSPLFGQLLELNLALNSLCDEGVAALAGYPMPRLQWLDLHSVRVGDRGACALAASSFCSGLRFLDLSRNLIGREGACALVSSPSLPELAWLVLECNGLHDPALLALVTLPGLRRLEHLHLSENRFSDRGIQALAESPYVAGLKWLELRATDFGPAGAIALARSPHLAGLRCLNLAGNAIGDEGALALAESPHLGDLVHLDVDRTGITPEGLAPLRQRFGEAVIFNDPF
jgi:uncharacterized protein (TIGR02996 family)